MNKMLKGIPELIRRHPKFFNLLLAVLIITLLVVIIMPAISVRRQMAPVASYQKFMWSSFGKPQAAIVTVPSWLSTSTTWNQAYQTIRTNLVEMGFSSFGLYLIQDGDGFFIITAPERIQANGMPAMNRWDLARHFLPQGSLKEWLAAFFSTAPEGQYRIYIFAVTGEAPINSTNISDWGDLYQMAARSGDYLNMPSNIRDKKIGDARLHGYVYLYERERDETFPHPLDNQTYSAQEHLQKSNLENLLK